MLGKGIDIIASSRAVYSLAPNRLTFTVPDAAEAGDVLLALLLSKPGEGFDLPAGWTDLGGPGGATEAQLQLIGRVHEAEDPTAIAVTLAAATDEWQGMLLVIRGASLGALKEATASEAFVGVDTPSSPDVANEQPLNVLLGVWSASGFTLMSKVQAGVTTVDRFSTAVLVARSLLVVYAITKASAAAYDFGTALSDGGLLTGRSFVTILRQRALFAPAVLDDPVPGNIGLLV